MSDKVLVIGGGLGGLAAACTLAARGHRVELFEANEHLGGKAAVLSVDGFRFDMGPTILTLPGVLARVFSEAGRQLEDYIELERLDPQWRNFFTDGSVLDLMESVPEMQARLRAFAGDDTAAGYARFIDLSEQLNEISTKYFFWRSVGGIRDTLNVRSSFKLSTLKELSTLRMGATVAETIRSQVPDHRVSQMLDHFTQYVGSSPFGSPAVLCGIAHMQLSGGVWYPAGGTRAVPKALAKLATELGVRCHLGTEVSHVLDANGAVRGVVLEDGRRVEGDIVVSNMDSVRTHRELVAPARARAFVKRRRYEPACSGVVLYLGLDRRYEHLAHHNFVFSENPESEFSDIYERGEPARDPSCYVAAPSVSDPSVAPAGGEALYVLVHTPYLRPHHDWSRMLPDYRQRIIEKLKTTGGMPDIESRIVTESALTPQHIHDRYRVLDGAIYGLASHGKWLGAFKPANRSPDLGGLYLAGGSAHPGPGMPMALMSGWIAADTADRDLRQSSLGGASSAEATA